MGARSWGPTSLGPRMWTPTVGSMQLGAYNWEPTVLGLRTWEPTAGSLQLGTYKSRATGLGGYSWEAQWGEVTVLEPPILAQGKHSLGGYSGRLQFSSHRFGIRASTHWEAKVRGYSGGGYSPRATDFGSGQALTGSLPWDATVLEPPIWAHSNHSLGACSLGVYSLGLYSLEATVLQLPIWYLGKQ